MVSKTTRGKSKPEGAMNLSAEKSPNKLEKTLHQIIENEIQLSVMIWGPPGVGKSSIVAASAKYFEIKLVDLRLSQLAPTDLRGLPVAKDGKSIWYPPEFFPNDGRGILFLDEINMAPPAMQGIAQQLILDRKVGGYTVPPGWFVWAAGNRKEDMASVFEMPAPLANRFIHLNLDADIDSFKEYALGRNLDERLIAFLAFRPELLHNHATGHSAWPSPRSWEMASQLLTADIPLQHAVGDAAAAEFEAFIKIYQSLPELEPILKGKTDLEFPKEPSARYAVTVGLTIRSTTPKRAEYAIEWMGRNAPMEWFQLFAGDLITRLRKSGKGGELVKSVASNKRLKPILTNFREVLIG